MKHFIYPLVPLQKAFIVLFLLIISIIGYSQPQQREWALPGNEIKFTPSPSVNYLALGSSYGGGQPISAANSMADYNGNLLFYVMEEPGGSHSNINIYDKEGNIIDNLKFVAGPSLNANVGCAGEISLIPVPNSCLKYYIVVGIGDDLAGHGIFHPEYAILDLTKPNIYNSTKFGALEYF